MSSLICFATALSLLWQVKALTFPLFENLSDIQRIPEIERVYLHVIKKQKDTMRGAVEKLEKLIK